MAEALQEVTKWEGNFPNHQYLVEGSKVLAYIKEGTKKPHYLSHPMNFDKRGRKFVTLKKNPFKDLTPSAEIVEVQGSKGNVYQVNITEGTCSCPSATFRGKCKHLDAVMKK